MQGNRTTAIRPAFTVIELMVVISIIALLAAMAASALSNAAEMARAQRTRAIIDKIDQLIMEKWESYRTRAVPYARHPTNNTQTAKNRLDALHELMRMELPDRIGDLCTDSEMTQLNGTPAQLTSIDPTDVKRLTTLPVSSAARGYKRMVQSMMSTTGQPWTMSLEQSECLYLILAGTRDGDKSALEFLTPAEIGNTDGDAVPEILDGWGQPIRFLRWAPGYVTKSTSTYEVLTSQIADASKFPDPFDPLRVGPAWSKTSVEEQPYALTPLLFSAGADGEMGIILSDFEPTDTSVNYPVFQADAANGNNPYLTMGKSGKQIGEPYTNSTTYTDNITNHYRGE